MYFFTVAFGLLLHVLFWGVGIAVLTMPRPWQRFWPVLAGPAGLALQALVVWVGAYANLPGTNCYALPAEVMPALLLGVALWRNGGRKLWADVSRFGALWLVMAICVGALVLPLARAYHGLTTMSLGSCDAADYAAGARVLMEFAHSDRGGFLGLTEVVSVMSVDNFFDFWLRLNHFTPSALLALNGTVFHCQPHELTSVMTVVLLVTSLPVVFWMARAVMGYRRVASVWLAALYGLSPITWYAVYHVAMGQLVAAPAIALITWAGVALWRGGLSWSRGFAMGGVLAVGYSLLLGGYNFILIVCFVPVLAYVGGQALWRRAWSRLGRWAAIMIGPLLVCGVVFAQRVAGLAERFQLFQTYDFGWRIPLLSPEGWLGMVAGAGLEPFGGGQRFVLAAVATVTLAVALLVGAKRRRREVYLALCLTVPVLAGYGYLNWRGDRLGTNASYDAYKLFSVFYPGILAALCYWVTLGGGRGAGRRWLERALAVVITGFTLHAAYRFADRMETAPLIVSRELLEMRKIEAMPAVASVNLLLPDMWTRLWANELLLRKPQYFSTHTYEGRRNTPLRGDWDLNGDLVQIELPAGDSQRINAQFSLANTHSPYFFRARIGENDGWYPLERPARAAQPWRWTGEVARIHLENFQDHPLRITCVFREVHALGERDFQVWVDGQLVHTARVGQGSSTVRVPEVVVPAGGAVLEIRTSTPLTTPGGGDNRLLGFRIFGVEMTVR